MRSLIFIRTMTALVGLLAAGMSVFPGVKHAAAEQPPIAQPLVREGTMAVNLVGALGLGTSSNEAEAESTLGALGISPRNGWIADYPVTPDIVGELENAIMDAADSGRLSMGGDDALKAFDSAMWAYNLNINPADQSGDSAGNYEPDAAALDNYYNDEGPPVVTYYEPPPYYYAYYTWVPYPFWWWDTWFPGFFVLADFHKVVIVNKQPVVISNHTFNRQTRRMAVIDPVSRAAVDPASKAGRRTFVGAGTPGAGREFPNAMQGGTGTVSGSSGRPAISNSGRTAGAPSGGSRTFSAPAGNRGTWSSPSVGSGPTHCTVRC